MKKAFSLKRNPNQILPKLTKANKILSEPTKSARYFPKTTHKDFPALPYFTKLQSNNRVNAVALQ